MTAFINTVKFFPYLFRVCIPSNPAKKRSRRPSDRKRGHSSVIIVGNTGKDTKIGNLKIDSCCAAETIAPVNKTNIMSIIVKRPEKNNVVFHENKLPR